jgi:DNA-binding CsgD family transcriptional regulator
MRSKLEFQDLVEKIRLINPRDDQPEAVLRVIAESYGMSHVAYLGLQFPGATQKVPFGHVTYPQAWVDRYTEQGYVKIDPVIAAALKSVLPINWGDVGLNRKDVRKLFGEAKEFGIGTQGLTFPIRGYAGDRAFFTIVGDMNGRDWESFRAEYMAQLNILSLYVHNMIQKKLNTKVFEVNSTLSPREVECLKWCANGKTFGDIGKILSISENTVKMYLDTARHKLNCLNITHAVARAIQLDLISAPQ